MRQGSEATGFVDEEPTSSPTEGDREGALTLALRRCAAGDHTGIDELRRWEDGRLRGMLLRMLGDPALASHDIYASWENALRLPGVHGLVVGRTLLYPPDGDVAGAVDRAADLVHGAA